jgi:hypothetical protein
MVDIDIIFKGADNSSTEENQLQVFCNMANRISITIYDEDINHKGYPTAIQLTKETAIRFHRELKKQISFIESEVNNG